MRTLHCLTLAVALSIAACENSSSDAKEAGYQALQSGDFEGAVASFEEALATRSTGDADYVEVAVGHCQALAHVDAAKTKTTFLALGILNGGISIRRSAPPPGTILAASHPTPKSDATIMPT